VANPPAAPGHLFPWRELPPRVLDAAPKYAKYTLFESAKQSRIGHGRLISPQIETNERVIRCVMISNTQRGNIMPKEMHQKAAEQHEQTAKAHRTAAEQHGSSDHVSGKQQSAQAAEKSKTAHEHSTQANNKSQQQK